MFNCILGQLRPSAGEVHLDGRSVTGMRPCDLNRLGVSRTFQLLQIFPQLTARENLILAGQEHKGKHALAPDRPARCRAFRRRRTGCWSSSGSSISPTSRRAGLSYGQQKLLDAAMAFMAGPRLALLDEPAGGVNLTMLASLRERLKAINVEQGATFVVIEHNMEFVMALCNRILVLAEGRIIARRRSGGGPPRSQSDRGVSWPLTTSCASKTSSPATAGDDSARAVLRRPARRDHDVIGPNGSGKSTAFKASFGMLPVRVRPDIL